MLYAVPWYPLGLVAVVAAYWLLLRGAQARRLLLIAGSLALLFSLQPFFTAVLIGWTLAVYAIARRLRRDGGGRHRRLLTFAVLGLLGYLAFFKYLPSLLATIFGGRGEVDWLVTGVVLPLGISYFTFRFVHYLVDAYRGQLDDYSFPDFFLYSVFFPILPAGPIERIERFIANRSARFDAADFCYGLTRIVLGAAKKLLVVDIVLAGFITSSGAHGHLLAGDPTPLHVGEVWFFLCASFLYAYLDFSAYSDIAIGTARLFGYRICENFHFPVFRRNLSEFWKHWHMSLSQWCRDYIYLPVLGATRRPRLALYASMMTIGAWHFVNFNWLTWGALHATGLVCVMEYQRFVRRRKIKVLGDGHLGHLIGMTLTFGYVCWVFAFVCIPSPVAATRAFVFAATGTVPF